jgi:hypothetical protein
LENEFLTKGSSGSNVILEEIQDISHNIISDTDKINPPLDFSANKHLEELNPQIVVKDVLVPSSSASTQVEAELNPHIDVNEVRQPEEQVLRMSHRTVCCALALMFRLLALSCISCCALALMSPML